jgi:hypothetical protein
MTSDDVDFAEQSKGRRCVMGSVDALNPSRSEVRARASSANATATDQLVQGAGVDRGGVGDHLTGRHLQRLERPVEEPPGRVGVPAG